MEHAFVQALEVLQETFFSSGARNSRLTAISVSSSKLQSVLKSSSMRIQSSINNDPVKRGFPSKVLEAIIKKLRRGHFVDSTLESARTDPVDPGNCTQHSEHGFLDSLNFNPGPGTGESGGAGVVVEGGGTISRRGVLTSIVKQIQQKTKEVPDSDKLGIGKGLVMGDEVEERGRGGVVAMGEKEGQREGREGMNSSLIRIEGESEAAGTKFITPETIPGMPSSYGMKEPVLQPILLRNIHHTNFPGRKEKTEAIPKGHEKGTREKGGATFTTVDPEKVAKAIGMDDTM